MEGQPHYSNNFENTDRNAVRGDERPRVRPSGSVEVAFVHHGSRGDAFSSLPYLEIRTLRNRRLSSGCELHLRGESVLLVRACECNRIRDDDDAIATGVRTVLAVTLLLLSGPPFFIGSLLDSPPRCDLVARASREL